MSDKPMGLEFDKSPQLSEAKRRSVGPKSDGSLALEFENSPELGGDGLPEKLQLHDNQGRDVLVNLGGYISLREVLEKSLVQRNDLNLRNADLGNMVMTPSSYVAADFSGSNVSGTTWLDSDLRRCRFEDIDAAQPPRFVNCDLRGVALAGLRARGATFVQCKGVDGS